MYEVIYVFNNSPIIYHVSTCLLQMPSQQSIQQFKTEIMQQADKNNDGKLELEEFKRCVST